MSVAVPTPKLTTEQWAFRDLRGPKATVLAKISESTAPETAKTFLTALISARNYDGIRLDSQGHEHNGHFVEHTTIAQLY